MQYIKKTLSKFILLCMTFMLAFSTQGMTALADDDPFATENARIKTELEAMATDLTDSGKEDLSKRLQAIINALDALDDDDDTLTSAIDGKDLIVSVMEDPKVLEAMGLSETDKYDYNLLIVQKAWVNSFGKSIAQYGFSLNEYAVSQNIDRENSDDDHLEYDGTGSLNDTGHIQTDSDQQQAQESSKMIQKLRWGRKNNDSNVNIVGFLKKFEQNATFANVATILQSIAAALVFAFGANNLLKISSDRMASYDAVLREFAKVLFGVWFIFNYRYFTILVMRVGTYFTEIILDGVTATDSSQSQIAATLRYGLWKSLENTMADGSAGSLLEGVASAATNVLGYTGTNTEASGWDNVMEGIAQLFGGMGDFLGGNAVGGTIVNLAINWVVFAILIELAIRYIFTPIAIADLYSEGFHSNGMRWIKKLLSCCIAGGLIYISMYAANILKTQLTGIHPLQTAAINLTMVGFFAKSRQIADEIVGVR